MHFGTELVNIGRLEFGTTVIVPFFNVPLRHVRFVIGVEFLVSLKHFPGLGCLAIVDSNVFGARVVENVHFDKAERSRFGHSTGVGGYALCEASKRRFTAMPLSMATKTAMNAVNAELVARRATQGCDVCAGNEICG